MRKIVLFRRVLLMFVGVIIALCIYAQDCPNEITFGTHTTTQATCAHNGKLTVVTNETLPNTAIYQIVTGPAGFSSSPQSSASFNNLKPGNYTIKVTCSAATATTGTITVGGSYIPVAAFDYSPLSCPTGTNYAAIKINSVTGGNAPYRYGYVLSNNAGEPDGAFIWSTNSTIQLPTSGTYQIRVQDIGCETSVTRTYSPPAKATFSNFVISPVLRCGNKFNYAVSYTANGSYTPSNIHIYVYGGGADVSPSNGVLLDDLVGNSNTTRTRVDINLVNPGITHVYAQFIDPCGNEVLHSLKALPAEGEGIPSLSGMTAAFDTENGSLCDPTTDPNQKVSFRIPWSGVNSPQVQNIFVTGYDGADATGNISINEVDLLTISDRKMNYARSYKFRFVTGCGEFTQIVNLPPPTPLKLGAVATEKIFCPTPDDENVKVTLTINGYLPDNTTIKVVGGPTGMQYNAAAGGNTKTPSFFLPVGSYQIIADNANCTLIVDNSTFSVSMPTTVYPDLTREVTVNSKCNDGQNSIVVKVKGSNLPNHGSKVLYLNRLGDPKLLFSYGFSRTSPNIDETVTIDNTNMINGGQLLPGKYIVRVTVPCNFCCGSDPIRLIDTVEIFSSDIVRISKQKAMNCDDGVGASIYFEFEGPGSFTIERALATDPDIFTLVTTTSDTYYLDEGLAANTSYKYKITNGCGRVLTTTASTSHLDNFQKLTTVNPCIGIPYDLSAEKIEGAVYSWTLNGNPLSNTTSSIHFDNYAASSDGLYVCTITLSNCIVRQLSFDVNSEFCNQPLYALFGGITAKMGDDGLRVDWEILKEINVDYYQIEISADGETFKPIGRTSSKVNGNTSEVVAYSFSMSEAGAIGGALGIILLPFISILISNKRKRTAVLIICLLVSGSLFLACNRTNKSEIQETKSKSLYVRIGVVDKDGSIAYSKVVKVVKD